MALIPSESLNFPDSFRANVGWRLPKEGEVVPMPHGAASSGPADIHLPHIPPNGHAEETGARPTNNGHPAVAEPVEREQAADVKPTQSEQAPPVSSAVETAAKHQPFDLLGRPSAEGQPESALQPAANGESTAPTLTVSGESAHALIAQLFRLQPITELPPEPANPPVPTPVAAEPEPIPVAANPPEQAVVTPVIPAPASADPAPEIQIPRKVDFNFMGSSAPASVELPSEPAPVGFVAPAETVVEPVSAPEPMVVQTAAQAQHLFELIAAAVERGALVGGPVTEPPPSIPPQPVASPPSQEFHAPPPPIIQSTPPTVAAPAQAPSPIPQSTVLPVRPADGPRKTPAKIRITPRKIKPRPIPPTEATPAAAAPVLPPETEVVPGTHFTPAPPPVSQPVPISRPAVSPPVVPEPEKMPAAPPVVERWEPKHPPRRIHTVNLAETALASARERRNRWIGFGLSEAAALTALVLLARFALTHKFPDPTLKVLVFILALAAAAIAIALPIPFVRNDPARWQR